MFNRSVMVFWSGLAALLLVAPILRGDEATYPSQGYGDGRRSAYTYVRFVAGDATVQPAPTAESPSAAISQSPPAMRSRSPNPDESKSPWQTETSSRSEEARKRDSLPSPTSRATRMPFRQFG